MNGKEVLLTLVTSNMYMYIHTHANNVNAEILVCRKYGDSVRNWVGLNIGKFLKQVHATVQRIYIIHP